MPRAGGASTTGAIYPIKIVDGPAKPGHDKASARLNKSRNVIPGFIPGIQSTHPHVEKPMDPRVEPGYDSKVKLKLFKQGQT